MSSPFCAIESVLGRETLSNLLVLQMTQAPTVEHFFLSVFFVLFVLHPRQVATPVMNGWTSFKRIRFVVRTGVLFKLH